MNFFAHPKKNRHHILFVIGIFLIVISIVLSLAYLKSSKISQVEIDNLPTLPSQIVSPTATNLDPNTLQAPFQTKNYNDYGLSFSIPSSWFESESTVTPNLYLSFKKSQSADIIVSTAKSFVGHGVEGELVSKEKITISGIQGDIQIWEAPGRVRSIIVNNLEKDGLFYTFETFIYEDFEINDTEFRDFLRSITFR